jgi:hypothetical protein
MLIPSSAAPRSTSNGHARVLGSGAGVAMAAASSGALLAVVTQERKRKHFLSCFSVQVGCWASLRIPYQTSTLTAGKALT